MAEPKKSLPMPMLPINHWWALRKKFKQSIPGVVTDGFLATVLSMQVNSARANVLPYLKQMGIIDDDGKTGERAAQWRDDALYPEVCKEIIDDVYPRELVEAVPDPNRDRAAAERWFANYTRAGESAVKRMATLYAVLVDADPSKQTDQEKKERTRNPGEDRPKRQKKAAPVSPVAAATRDEGHAAKPLSAAQQGPGININLQIHISADSTTDQIDQIFASMAKHIYQRG